MNIKKILAGIVSVIIIVVLLNSFFVVQETEQAIVTEFGKPVEEAYKEAGIYFLLPWRKVRFFEKRILKLDGEPNEIPTNDKTFIWVDTTARWKIINPLVFFQRLNNEFRAETFLSDLIEGTVRDLVTKNDLAEIIVSSDWKEEYSVTTEASRNAQRKIEVGRDKIALLIQKSIKSVASSYGIEIVDVLIKRLNYTNKVRTKVYDRMISERKRIAAQKRSEGEGQKAEILGQLSRELNNVQSEAFRESQTIRGIADAEATRIYGTAYSVDPKFYEFYVSLESYKDILQKNTTLVIEPSSTLYKTLTDLKIQ